MTCIKNVIFINHVLYTCTHTIFIELYFLPGRLPGYITRVFVFCLFVFSNLYLQLLACSYVTLICCLLYMPIHHCPCYEVSRKSIKALADH